MIKDFRDANKDIIVLFRGTDSTHKFNYMNEDGSSFVGSDYNLSCECKVAYWAGKVYFSPAVQYVLDPELGLDYVEIDFPRTIISDNIRENTLYYRVLAAHKITGDVKVINYGEIWLR